MAFNSLNCLTLIMSTLIHLKGVLLPSYMELLGQIALRIFIGPLWRQLKRSSKNYLFLDTNFIDAGI